MAVRRPPAVPNTLTSASEMFKRCVAGSYLNSTSSIGLPDGDNQPSVTMDLRSIHTLKPLSNGSLKFAIFPSSRGALVMVEGSSATSLPEAILNLGAGLPSGITTYALPAGTPFQGLIPDSRMGGSFTTGWGSVAAPLFTAFRSVVTVADINYTGTTLQDSGAVTIDTCPSTFVDNGTRPWTYDTTKSHGVRVLDSGTVSDILFRAGSSVNSVTMPARKAFTTRVLGSGNYHEFGPRIHDTDDVAVSSPFAYACANATTQSLPGPVYEDTSFKCISYTGLDPDASITVSLRYCVQVSVGASSPMFTVAKASPPKDTPTMDWYERLRSYLPTVEQTINAGITLAEMALPRIVGGSMRPALKALTAN